MNMIILSAFVAFICIVFIIYKAQKTTNYNVYIFCYFVLYSVPALPCVYLTLRYIYVNGVFYGIICSFFWVACYVFLVNLIKRVINAVLYKNGNIFEIIPRRWLLVLTIFIAGEFVYLKNKQRYIIVDASFSDACVLQIYNINYIKTSLTLSEIEAKYPNFQVPCKGCGEEHPFNTPEASKEKMNISQMTLSKFIWLLSMKKQSYYYDYCSYDSHFMCMRSAFYKFPGEGTYLDDAGGFMEISDGSFSVICCWVPEKMEIYRLDDSLDLSSLSNISMDNFKYYKTVFRDPAHRTLRISLPLGIYLFKNENLYCVKGVIKNG